MQCIQRDSDNITSVAYAIVCATALQLGTKLEHRVGNLLLVTSKANSRLGNKAYLGPNGKYAIFKDVSTG
jgi:hypothetical protein